MRNSSNLHMILLSCAMLCCVVPTATAAAVDEAVSPADRAPSPVLPDDGDQDAAGEVKLSFMPSNFNLNRSISFDENGEPRHRNNHLSISFRCFYETTAVPLAYRDLTVTSVITSAGEELEIDPDQQHRGGQNIHPDRQMNGKPYFDLYLNLPAPTRSAESLREVRGTLKMDLSRGPERVLRLSPVSKYIGKRFRVTDMEDSPMSMREIEAQNNQPAMIEWTYARTLEPLIQEVKFYRRNGVEFDAERRGGSGDNTTRTQRFAVGAADDVVMVVRLFRETRTVELPFVVRDLELPNPEPQGRRFDLAIATEPAGPAQKNGGAVAVPDDNELPIMIIE